MTMNMPFSKSVLAAGIVFEISAFTGIVLAQDASKDNTATLTGVVGESVKKALAEQIALGVEGIEDVKNELEISEDHVAMISNGEHSFGEKMDDFSIGTVVKSKLLWRTHTDGMATEVTSEAGVVTLQGTAKNDISRDFAEQIALNNDGVRKVDNQLKIASADSALEAAGEVLSDTWITSRVSSTFLYSSSLDSSDIDVETASGVVTLSGELASSTEQELAIELTSHIRGVQEVNSDALTLLVR
jgi:hyperosmotically inducible protein